MEDKNISQLQSQATTFYWKTYIHY